MTELHAKSPALFDMVKDCTTPAQTLSKVADWLDHLITAAFHSANNDDGSPRIIGIKEDPKFTMVCRTFDNDPDLDVSTDAWYSRVSLQDVPNAIYQASTAMKKQGEVTNTVQDAAWSAIREKTKQDEDEATNRLVNNFNSVITKYLDVGEALGLVGHDRGLIASELFSEGKTRQIGKSHECILRKIKALSLTSETQAISITEHKTALNAAHDEIAKLKAEIAALKAAPPTPPPSDPLATAYAVIGEMVVKQRAG